MKTYTSNILKQILPLALSVTFFSNAVYAQKAPGLDYTAHDIFMNMYEQGINLKAMEIPVLGMNRDIKPPVTFGAEKEGSSSKILRVMSPSNTLLVQAIVKGSREFWVPLIQEFLVGQHRNKKPVIDSEGKVITLNAIPPELLTFDWQNAGPDELKEAATAFAGIFPRSPFSFFDKKTVKVIYDKGREAQRSNISWALKSYNYDAEILEYDYWEPLIGESEKYIFKGHKELNQGWEIIFKPQTTYADFENMQTWFRTLMGSSGQLFEAPGHQRVVMPLITNLLPEQTKMYEGHVGEVARMLQSYVVLRGIQGNTGLLGAKHKMIAMDDDWLDMSSGRGPLRLEKNRFYPNSIGVEFRVGMKDEVVRRFVQAIFASRLSTNEMKDLATVSSYSLVPPVFENLGQYFDYAIILREEPNNQWILKKMQPITEQLKKLSVRFDLPFEEIMKAVGNFTSVEKRAGLNLHAAYLMPMWNWDEAPFLKGKTAEINRISREFIIKLAALEKPSYAQINQLLHDWAVASDLTRDIEKYLTPKKAIDHVTSPLEVKVKADGVDVNKIDLGSEFTARMPLKLKAEYDANGVWTSTIYDMTPESRQAKIKSVAESIKEMFTGDRTGVTPLQQGSHGHSLSIAYEFKDAKDRTWRVEWDGVTRNYDSDGNIVTESARGGHIEIVSPKYNPTMAEIQGVYAAMEKEGVIPDYRMGGSHINIDYELFEQNPKAMARFLTIFHQNRGIIAYMFQHMNRLRSAEPVEISENLDKQLRDFKGNKEDLAALLYSEKYFNQRKNRKTRYTQIDVSNFMGNVIPEKYVMPDFDVVKARFTGGDGWTQQFRVTKYKKLEMRLFDAPKDPLEAALQIKVVRAMLNLAINDTAPLTDRAQFVDYEGYTRDPNQAYTALNKMVKQLNLNVEDYMPYVMNKLVINKKFIQSKFYENWFSYADRVHPKAKDWGAPVRGKSGDAPIYSDRFTAPAPHPVVLRCEGVFQ